jgi:WhiB family redox-sensing transcriptional regulator
MSEAIAHLEKGVPLTIESALQLRVEFHKQQARVKLGAIIEQLMTPLVEIADSNIETITLDVPEVVDILPTNEEPALTIKNVLKEIPLEPKEKAVRQTRKSQGRKNNLLPAPKEPIKNPMTTAKEAPTEKQPIVLDITEPDEEELKVIEQDNVAIELDEIEEADLISAEVVSRRVRELRSQADARHTKTAVPKPNNDWLASSGYQPFVSAHVRPKADKFPTIAPKAHLTSEGLVSIEVVDRLCAATSRLVEAFSSPESLRGLTAHEEMFIMQLQDGKGPRESMALIVGSHENHKLHADFAALLLSKLPKPSEMDRSAAPIAESTIRDKALHERIERIRNLQISESSDSDEDIEKSFMEVDEEVLEWQAKALCAQTDPEAFFPEKGGSNRDAKKVCHECEVRQECLEYALNNEELFGIWGGMSERERRKLKRRAS